MIFLKWHDGYSEPVTIAYHWSVFGFFWGVPTPNGDVETQKITGVATMAMVAYVFRYQIYEIRRAERFINQRQHASDVQV